MSYKAKILIVDDVPENISVLFDFLITLNYHVLIAQDGYSALEVIDAEKPDLVLLDVMMMGLDGFETCKRIKENPKTADIPVIFMTALSDTTDKLKGFELGAVDYVTKPIQQDEVLARIKAHLTIRHLQYELQQRNTELETKNDALKEKNAELDAFAYTVAHDLKNMLNVISGFAYVLNHNHHTALGEKAGGYTQQIYESALKASEIIDALLLLATTSKDRNLKVARINMSNIIPSVEKRLVEMLKQYDAELVKPDSWTPVYGYGAWLEEVWANYITNAIKYGGRPPRIELGMTEHDDHVKFWVKDNGDGLNSAQCEKLFTPFTRLHQHREQGHGLGLSIVQSIITKLDGNVGVESTGQMGEGCLFYFTLPTEVDPERIFHDPKQELKTHNTSHHNHY